MRGNHEQSNHACVDILKGKLNRAQRWTLLFAILTYMEICTILTDDPTTALNLYNIL